MKKTKEAKGITLVALVVTIIVLLIVSGVTINSIAGNNGLISKVKQATRENLIADEKELISMALLSCETQNLGLEEITVDSLKKEIKAEKNNIEVSERNLNEIRIVFNDSGNEYIVSINTGIVVKVE